MCQTLIFTYPTWESFSSIVCAAATVKHLKDKELILPVVSEEVPRRFMLGWDEKLDKLELSEFNRKKALRPSGV
ncbi:MAG: hypothetical protein AAFW70_20680 [Cyanobacteria bacterium J06635_10]